VTPSILILSTAMTIAMPSALAAEPTLPSALYTLDNGLTVILHEDHSLPQIVVDTWYGVGSKNEVPGRTGFAHLFEHLMFMGTSRLPGPGYDNLMEQYGGWNNAWTTEDETNFYDVGPSPLVDTILWMEADRMDGLGAAMTQEKLDLQRDVVRNERRQSVEDTPYGIAWELLPAAMYPAGHPYDHSVIGSHEDLLAATVDDVQTFFATWYAPNNATLVVAGDFDPAKVKSAIASLYGGISPSELPEAKPVELVDLPVQPLVETTDQVQLAATMLSWHTDVVYSAEDAAMDLTSTILGDGRSSRLYSRLVHDEGAVTEIQAYQQSQIYGGIFQVFALLAPESDLPTVEGMIQDEIDRLAADGPTPAELERALNQNEFSTIRHLEDLQSRAVTLAQYQVLAGTPDYLAQDLARYRAITPADIQAAAARLSATRRQTLRVRPETPPDAIPGSHRGEQ